MSKNRQVSTLDADGSTTALDWSGAYIGHLAVYGDFGSGTATLQYSLDGGSTYKAVDSTNLAFTEDGAGNFELPTCKLRVNLADSTDPDLTVVIAAVSAVSR